MNQQIGKDVWFSLILKVFLKRSYQKLVSIQLLSQWVVSLNWSASFIQQVLIEHLPGFEGCNACRVFPLSAKKWAVSNCSPLRHNWGTLEVLCKVLPGKIPQGWYFTYCFVIWALRASINTDVVCSWVVQASRIAYLQEYRARKRIMTLTFDKCEISVRNFEIWNVLPRHPHKSLLQLGIQSCNAVTTLQKHS